MRMSMRWEPAVLLACAGLAVCVAAPGAWAQATGGEQPEQPPVAEPPAVDEPPAVEPMGEAEDGDLDDLVDLLGEQPGLDPAAVRGQETITLSVFSEPVELRALVEYVAEVLNVTIVASEGLTGSITINSPVTVPKGELLDLLSYMLEQNNFALVSDRPGFYRIVASDAVAPALGGPLATTRIIPTGPVRPSALSEVFLTQLGMGTAMQGGGRPGTGRVAFMDDLGVIVVTDTPSRVRLAEELVQRLLERRQEQRLLRFDLDHVAATVARERVIDLVGRGGSQMPGFNLPPEQRQGLPGQALANLSERLSVDPRGNALIFRGTPAEAVGIENALRVIDVPVSLRPRRYFAGAYALQIAQIAKDQGLGDIQVLEQQQQQTTPGGFQQGNFNAQRLQQMQQEGMAGFGMTTEAMRGGPTMVVDPARGSIVYYGTEAQQTQLGALIEQFDVDLEEIVIQEYKLHNADAETVAELLNGLVQNQLPSGESPLLPGGAGGGAQQFFQRFQQQMQNQAQRNRFRGGGPLVEGEDGAIGFDAEQVFVIPDPANNQVIVKASGRVQQQFARLIERIDLRRPQVFIDVQIVAVSASDEFRLAFETQLINAGGAGGVVNTNFGLTSPPADITERKTVSGALAGLTAALIDSDQVPIVINALQRASNTRILSSPQLLVDDNEEAEIASIERQPYEITTITTGNPVQTSFEYAEAGTRLTVTPSISEGGYIRLNYSIILSSFTGARPAPNAPPPIQERSLNSEAVTIPGDSTIVVGGIRVSTDSNTVIKVPLLGDIPLIGHLFRDTNENDSRTTLYVFITPRILRDPHFRDLLLLTKGPQAEVGVDPWVPELQPSLAEISIPPRRSLPPAPSPAEETGAGLPADRRRERE